MLPSNTIQYCSRKEIEIDKWNACLQESANGLIYSHSNYLDALCDNWDALIIDNYKAVMPLPWRKKAGIKYLYAPPLMQQLGITGNHEIADYGQLFATIKNEFSYGDIFFNYSNSQLPVVVSKKTNFILTLNKSYTEIAAEFSIDLKKNLKRARQEDFLLSNDYHHKMIISLFKENYGNRMPHVGKSFYEKFSFLCDQLEKKNMVLTRTIRNKQNHVLATALFLLDDKRMYNLMNTTTTEGRKAKANHFLLSHVIKEFSGRNLLFDFEGSDLPGVKQFYQNFGSVNQPYFHYHFNNLPFPLNLIKK